MSSKGDGLGYWLRTTLCGGLGCAVAVLADWPTAPCVLTGVLIGLLLSEWWRQRSQRMGAVVALVAVLAVGATGAVTPSAHAAAPTATMRASDHAALVKLRRTGRSRVWHPAAHRRTPAQLVRLRNRVIRYVGLRLRRQQIRRHGAARAAYAGINLTTNIACMVGNSHLDLPAAFVYRSQGFHSENTCPDEPRRFGTPDDVAVPVSDSSVYNPLAYCQNIAWVTGNDLFYVTGWTGQGVVTVLNMCGAGDIGPIRTAWGGPDPTFAERSVPEVAPLVNAFFGWTA